MRPLNIPTFKQLVHKENLLYWIIGINLLVRLIIVMLTSLGNDEAYYTSYALFPDWSYFDHPPMMGILIKLSTLNLTFLYNDFFVRLGALVVGSINVYLIYQIGKLLRDRRTGLIAALLLCCSFYSSIIAGTFILPDTPLSLFWMLSIWALFRYVSSQHKSIFWLLLFGITTGLALLSKYQAIFLCVGALSYYLINGRKKIPFSYLGYSIIMSALIFSPVIFWNLTSPYSGFSYHTGRIAFETFLPSLDYFFPEFLGQMFYHNPFNFFLIALALYYIAKRKLKVFDTNILVLLCMSLPLMLTTIGISFYNKTLPHWSGPAYFSLLLLAAYMSSIYSRKILKPFIIYGHVFFVVVILLALIQTKTGMLLSSSDEEPTKVGEHDFTLDLLWKDIGEAIASHLNIQDREFTKNIIITHNWFPAGHIDYYYALRNGIKLYVVGSPNNQHQYVRTNRLRGEIPLNTNAYYITTSNYYDAPDSLLISKFESVKALPPIPIITNGRLRVNVFIWKMNNMRKKLVLSSLQQLKQK